MKRVAGDGVATGARLQGVAQEATLFKLLFKEERAAAKDSTELCFPLPQ